MVKSQNKGEQFVGKDQKTILRVELYNMFGRHIFRPFADNGSALHVTQTIGDEKRMLSIARVLDRSDAHHSEYCRHQQEGSSSSAASVDELADFGKANVKGMLEVTHALVDTLNECSAFVRSCKFLNQGNDMERSKDDVKEHVEELIMLLTKDPGAMEKNLRRATLVSSRMYSGAKQLNTVRSWLKNPQCWQVEATKGNFGSGHEDQWKALETESDVLLGASSSGDAKPKKKAPKGNSSASSDSIQQIRSRQQKDEEERRLLARQRQWEEDEESQSQVGLRLLRLGTKDEVKKQVIEQEKDALTATCSSLQHSDAQTLPADAFTMLQVIGKNMEGTFPTAAIIELVKKVPDVIAEVSGLSKDFENLQDHVTNVTAWKLVNKVYAAANEAENFYGTQLGAATSNTWELSARPCAHVWPCASLCTWCSQKDVL